MVKQLQEVFQELKQSLNTEEADIEAKIILEHVLNISSSELISEDNIFVTKNQLKKIYEVRDKRNSQHIPLAYLLEEAIFRDLKLFVNRDVLIPRPETELLIDIVLEEIKNHKISQPTILDLGTGSGCIAIALKLALPAAKVYASDISRNSLSVASVNARRYNAEIDFIMGDYLDPFIGRSQSPIALPVMRGEAPFFDVIVSNPPYVLEADYATLAPELHHEPKHALIGFPYAHIKNQSLALLKPGGFMALEFGQGQEEKILEIFPGGKVIEDLSQIKRFVVWAN